MGPDNSNDDDSDDIIIPPRPVPVVEMVRSCAPNYRQCAYECSLCGGMCDYDVPVHNASSCGACIQARAGWRVVATYLPDHDDSAFYYLAVNPGGSWAILSADQLPDNYQDRRVGWDNDGNPIYRYRHMDLTSHILECLDAALRSRFLPTYASTWLLGLECTNILSYAKSKLNQVGPEQRLHQQAHNEALSALHATLLWRWSQYLSAGSSAPWQIRVWTPERNRAIVRLQAHVRGWLFRRSLYSPHTELGQRLQRLWAAFQHDY